jgi:hypothetical protein
MSAQPKPLFWTITGCDFGRSIAWAKKQPRLRDLIQRAVSTKRAKP